MPLFQEQEEQEVLHKSSKELETTVITASDVTQTAITNNISGFKWEVDYYNQILDNGDEPKRPDVTLNITLQSYRKIEKIEMILSSPLNSTNPNELMGEAYINIGSAVHKHDVIIGKIHNNKTAMFTIEEVYNETYEDNNIFKISFKLFGYSTDVSIYNNIINKVATNYVYNNDYKFSNNSPVILKKNAFNFDYGISTLKAIMNKYFNIYYNTKLNYIVLEDSDGILIDPYLNDFIIKGYSSIDYPVLNDLNKLVGDRTNDMTIYDGLVTNIKISRLDKLYTTSPSLYYNSVYYKNVLKVNFMIDKDIKIKKSYFEDKDYFISDNFYNNTIAPTDEFEILLKNFLEDKTVVPEDIVKLIDNIEFDNYKLDYFKIPILCFIYNYFLWKNL